MNTHRFHLISLVVLLFATVSCTKSVFGIGLVQTDEAESVTEISATVTGKVCPEPGMQDVMVGFLWSTDSHPDITNSQKVRVTEWAEGKPYSLRLAGLSPMTTYYYKAYVQYDGEVCKFGEVKSFTTRDVTVRFSLDAADVAPLSVQLSGSMVEESPEVLQHYVWFRLSEKEDMSELADIPEDKRQVFPDENGLFSRVIYDLKFGTRYYYDVIATVEGRTVTSEVKSFETPGYQYVAGEAVDLGLSVLWSSTNLGARSPEEPGAFFSWGETAPKHDYSSRFYRGYQADAVQTLLGDGWRMPTQEEFMALLTNTTRSVTTINGVKCAVLTSRIPGKTDQSIILPASGYFREDIRCGYEECRSWTSTGIWEGDSHSLAYACVINYGNTYTTQRSFGLPIRPVKDK